MESPPPPPRAGESGATVSPILTREERAAQIFGTERLARRDSFWALLGSVLSFFGWCALGLAGIALSFHMTDVPMARIAFWGGIVVGNSGMLATLVVSYRRGQNRGDW